MLVYAVEERALILKQPVYQYQRLSLQGRPWPRGRPRRHILMSLALALASKPQVLILGFEVSSPRKLPCPRLEDSTIF